LRDSNGVICSRQKEVAVVGVCIVDASFFHRGTVNAVERDRAHQVKLNSIVPYRSELFGWKFFLNQYLTEMDVSGLPVWVRKPPGIFAFTNLFRQESEWQLVSESPSAGTYVGFLFPCYSTTLWGESWRLVDQRVQR